MEIVDAARELGALGATISGAGPTVLVWTTWQDAGQVAAALEERCARLGRGAGACPSALSAPTSPSSDRMDWVVQIGLVELALGGLLGWAMVARAERPDWLRRIGVVAPQRIRQVHLDYVMMGLILIGVGLAVPDLPTAVAVALVFGTFVNPFLFVPLAFDPEVDKRLWYRTLAVVSFLGVSGSLVVAAIVGPG